MTWFADLSPCSYFGESGASVLRAVGWLDRGHQYNRSNNRSVYERLRTLNDNPWTPFVSPGIHDCELCEYDGEAKGIHNLFIPGDGILYVCPELIVHYMNARQYGPPEEFCEAVLKCPPMRSREYLQAVLANGGRVLMKAGGGKN